MICPLDLPTSPPLPLFLRVSMLFYLRGEIFIIVCHHFPAVVRKNA